MRIVLALVAMLGLAAPAHAACQLQKLGELPVTMHGTQPQTTVKVNGHEANFIVDSGAFHSILTARAAAEFGLKLHGAPVDLIVEGVGGRSKVMAATADDFEFAGFTYHHVEFLVVDQSYGSEVAGLIGQNVLWSADVEYDFNGGAVRFFVPKGCGAAPLAYWGDSSSIRLDETARYAPETIGTVYVNGVALKAQFDTGAWRTVIHQRGAEKFDFRPDAPGVKDAGYFTGVGSSRQVRAWVAPIASFKIGDEEVKNTEVTIGDIDGDLEENNADILVGADFFLAHRVYVSLAQRRMYFSYAGGPVFRIGGETAASGDSKAATPTAAPAASPPADADPATLARFAAAASARRDYASAITELTQAMALDPTNADYPLARAQAEVLDHRQQDAGKDIELVLKLRPDDTMALMMRGGGYLLNPLTAPAAHQDLDKVDKLLSDGSDQRLSLAAIYRGQQMYTEEIAQLDRWIAANPRSTGLGQIENERCWAKAESNRDLSGALSDCNLALKQSPGMASYLDSRGLVRLRMGDLAGAIHDYDAALARSPKQASSLYGRGVAKIKSGDKAAGEADIAAAVALEPKRADWAKAIGLTP